MSDHESEGRVGSPDRLEHPVDAHDKGRRETLVEQADEDGTDLTWEEFQSMVKESPKELYREIVEVIQSHRDINIRYQELKERYKKSKTEAQRHEAMIEGLLSRQIRQETPSEAAGAHHRSAKIKDPAPFSGKLDSGTIFEDWLVQVKNKLRGNRDWYTTDELKLIYVAGLLEGDALALVSTRLDPDHPQYYGSEVKLYEHLRELYADPNKEKNARTDFKRLFMKKDQTFQVFYATFLRLVADGHITSTDLKEDLNDKLAWKLQEAVAVYYNDPSIGTTQFAQHCTTLDQQIRNRAAKQERADKRAGSQPDKRKKTSKGQHEEPHASKSGDEKDNKDKGRGRRDHSQIKCYNCNKLGHFASDCSSAKKESRSQAEVARLEEETDSEEETGQAGKARP